MTYTDYINRDLPPLEKGCWSKARFATRGEAKALLSHGKRKVAGVKPYRCRYYGDHWHLGHPK